MLRNVLKRTETPTPNLAHLSRCTCFMTLATMEPSPEFRIELAVAADLHQLAEINRAAYVEETITRIAYPAWPDEANMLKMFLVRIEDRLSHKDTQVFKAVEPLSERAVGFACWTLERGSHGADTNEKEPSNPTTKALQLNTAGLNLEFLAAMGADAEALTSHRKGTEHYCKALSGNWKQSCETPGC